MCLCARDDTPAFGLKHRLSSFLTITVLYHLLCLHMLQISHHRETQIAGLSLLAGAKRITVFVLENGF